MIARLLDEPEMQFGRGAHVDPRFGLLDFGPADQTAEAAPARSRSASSAPRRRSKACCGGCDAAASRSTRPPTSAPRTSFRRSPDSPQKSAWSPS